MSHHDQDPPRTIVRAADYVTAFSLGALLLLAIWWASAPADEPSVTRPVTPPATAKPAPHRTITMNMGPRATTLPDTSTIPEGDMDEDMPGFNCLTMGNRKCGPDWKRLPDDVFAEIMDGEKQTATDYCVWLTDETTLIACSDGFTTTS
jgi:hypothetical protein